MDLLTSVTDAVLSWADTPWLLVAVALLATIDGFFPPLPSESVVIAAAVLIADGSGPSPWLLVLAAAIGAFTGDVIAYHLGMLLPVERLPFLATPRGVRTMARAEAALERRSTVLIMSARFIPVGRVAVNMTAGAVRFSRPRFVLTAAAASIVWGGYSTVIGLLAGHYFESHPLVAVAGGVTVGVALGFGFEATLHALNGWLLARAARRGESTRVAGALLRAAAPPEVLHYSEGERPPHDERVLRRRDRGEGMGERDQPDSPADPSELAQAHAAHAVGGVLGQDEGGAPTGGSDVREQVGGVDGVPDVRGGGDRLLP